MEAALAWVRAVGVRPGPSASPPARRLLPAVHRWCAANGWGVEPTDRQVGLAIRSLGVRYGETDRGRKGYRVPRELADAWWAEVGGRPTRPRKKGPRKPRQRKVPPLFHPVSYTARPVVDTLGRVYPTVGVAAAMVANLHGAGNHKALHNALKASRDGRVEWGGWRGLLWRYLTEAEVAAVPFGTRCGEAPPGWGFGLLRAPEVRGDDAREHLDGLGVPEGAPKSGALEVGKNPVPRGPKGVAQRGGEQVNHGSLPLWCDGGGV